ncbi:hypothetical protein V8G54_008772 [Vigna mungo]|uniref:Uncharacterized protein n=1 Tax=Vigna mungo TaxID=3915 RepID=A0AAQ3P4G3_VIGMU
MGIWHYLRKERYILELKNKASARNWTFVFRAGARHSSHILTPYSNSSEKCCIKGEVLCFNRLGCNDVVEDPAKFESKLIQNLKTFIQEEKNHMVEVEGNGNAIEQTTMEQKRQQH